MFIAYLCKALQSLEGRNIKNDFNLDFLLSAFPVGGQMKIIFCSQMEENIFTSLLRSIPNVTIQWSVVEESSKTLVSERFLIIITNIFLF